VPAAGRIFTFAATGNLFSERLKAVLRIRVVKTKSSAEGGLAMENVRVFPSASVSNGSVSVTSTDRPALKLNPGGFSKERPKYLTQLLLDASAWRCSLPSDLSNRPSGISLNSGSTSGGRGSFQSVKLQRPDRDTVCSHSLRDATANVKPILFASCPLSWSKWHLRSTRGGFFEKSALSNVRMIRFRMMTP
jgi:hypothetical protein